MRKGIIFDLDGTLWDSAAQIVDGWNIAFEKHGYEPVASIAKLKALMGLPMEDIMEALIPNLPAKERDSILKKCCEEEEKLLLLNGGILYPNLVECLEQLMAKGYHLYIVSNCQSGYIETFLSFHCLWDYFDDKECPGDSNMLKAENIRLIIERNNLDTAIYVGDIRKDYIASAKANVPFILANYGFGNNDVPESAGIINDLSELPELADAN